MSTILSLLELKNFFEKYRKHIKLPIANYGGGTIEGEEVRDILFSLKLLDPSGNSASYEISGSPTDNKGELRDILKSLRALDGYEILDLSTGIDLMKPINGKYHTGICMDILEHTDNPFVVAENISNSLNEKSLLFVTVPWVWGVHEFPVDNWRFTINGLTNLFPKFKVLESRYLEDGFDPKKNTENERVIVVFEKK